MNTPKDPEWEGTGEVREPVLNATAVQSVRFPVSDLKAIREAARRAGVTTSEFIREAAVAAARGTAGSGASTRMSFGSDGVTIRPPEDDTFGVQSPTLVRSA
jgi:hypothetical protein